MDLYSCGIYLMSRASISEGEFFGKFLQGYPKIPLQRTARGRSMNQKNPSIIIGAAVIILIAAAILITSQPPGSGTLLQWGIATAPAVTTTEPAPVANGTTVPRQSPEITEEQATALVREEYWDHEYSITRTSLTDRYTGKILYEFELTPTIGSVAGRNQTVYIDASTGDFYVPSQERAGISAQQAKTLARQAFPHLTPDRVKVRYNNGTQYIQSWEFYLQRDNATLVHGGLDPDTGELSWYAVGIIQRDRPENAMITIDAAQRLAKNEIEKRNGVLPLTMTEARYDPLSMPNEPIAGKYVFVYRRLIKGIPCDSDGLVIDVDSVSGQVTDYWKMWSTPESSVAASVVPAISRDTAITTVQQEASEVYPSSAAGFRIVSAELRWKDFHAPDKVPPLQSIPLAWKVLFDDETIRAQQWPWPQAGWVDGQNGTLLEMNYRH
jgi:hypothetical protein